MDLEQYLFIKKIKQKDFAKKVGCSQAHISVICAKKRRPSPDMAIKMVEATAGEVSLTDLLFPDREKAA
jgi:plasmid maintenance system antidote protein VapI